MKKKIITLIVVIILLLVVSITILFSKNTKKYIMQDGIMLALTLDGQNITSFPSEKNYRVNVECENAKGIWLAEEWSLSVEKITGNVTCNVDFYSNPITLKSEVESVNKTTQQNIIIPDYVNATTLTQSEYGIPSQFIGSSVSSTSGTTVTNAFSYNGTEWSSVPANLTSKKNYHFKFNIPSEGYYELCYTMSSGYASNKLYVYKNTTQLEFGPNSSYISSYNNSSRNGCLDIGKLTTSDYIKVVQYTYGSSVSPIATVSFYLKKTTEAEIYDVGYRYRGKQPNNWVWFNNEKWRIIGSIPVTLSDGTTSNLVKIIRNNSIGGLTYDAGYSNDTFNILWGNNTLYDLLNNYYYGKKDITGASPCISGYEDPYALCNYKEIGISSSASDYYGKMLKDVYWNVGTISKASSTAISTAYTLEVGTKSAVTGKIGLMSASDFGYAASGITYRWTYVFYATDYEQNNWLYGQGAQWTLTPENESTGYVIRIAAEFVSGLNANMGQRVRPVVYLDSSVYVVSGDGTEGNPYQIRM